MTLTEACARAFGSDDRSRGSTRQMLDRIKIQQAGQIGLLAAAKGSYDETYLVGIDFTDIDENVLGVHCDCPRFEDGHFCKHLWATIAKFELLYDVMSIKTHRLELYDVDPAEIELGSPIQKKIGSVGKRATRSGNSQSKSSTPSWKAALQRVSAAANNQHDTYVHK